MTDNTTNFLKRLKGIRLSSNERLRMREHLAAYSDMHPAIDGANESVSNGFFAMFSSRRFSVYAGALIALLVLGGSVTLAAEGSVPGDSLYAIKVNVNEPVMTAFAPTRTAQAKVAVDIATRRANEAVTLASRGTLTVAREQYLETEFDKKLDVVAKKTDALEQAGDAMTADTVKAELASNLAGEAQALGAVDTKDETGGRTHFLRVLVALNDTIGGDDTEAASAVTVAEATGEGTPTTHTFAAAAKVAAGDNASSTTEARILRKGLRFLRLHVTASTTLRALEGNAPVLPKLDTAIPQSSVTPENPTSPSVESGAAVETGGEQVTGQ